MFAFVVPLAIGAARSAEAQARAASAAGAQTLPVDAPSFAARIDSVLAPWAGTDRPGCAVGVSHRGRTVLERAYGMADLASGAPMTPATVVHSASLAKQVTALAVMLLVRDGKLSLDDDVRRWLPKLPRYETPITLGHLLSHTSGLRDFFELLIIARGRFEEERITDADAMDVVRRQRGLNFTPGTEYGYSNTNYLLASKIVERASGERFATFVRSRILAPLGMTHTSPRDDVTLVVPGRALGYTRDGAGWRTSVPNFDVLGATNLETTVGDLLRLSQNLDHPVVGHVQEYRARCDDPGDRGRLDTGVAGGDDARTRRAGGVSGRVRERAVHDRVRAPRRAGDGLRDQSSAGARGGVHAPAVT